MFPFHFCIFAFGLCLIFCNSISNVFCDGSVCSEAPYPAEIFSSMAKMQEHLRETRVAMRKVLPGLKSKVQEQKTRLETIKGYVKHLSELSGEEIRQPNFTVHHPLNAYRFIRNHSIIHNETATKLVSEIKLYEKEKVEILKMLNELPKLADTDYEGAIHGITTLQSIYDLKTSDIANGKIRNYTSGIILTAIECLDIAMYCFLNNKPYQGHAWLTQAAGKCLAEGNITTTVTRINIVAAKAASLVNQPEAAVFYYNEVVKIRDSRYHRLKLKEYLTETDGTAITDLPQDYTKPAVMNREQLLHSELCKGHQVNHLLTLPKPWRPLECRLETRDHPLLLLQPIKMEEKSLDPYIVVVHDIITPIESDRVSRTASPRLQRSAVGIGKSIVHKMRTSQHIFLDRQEYVKNTTFIKRVEAFTGLNSRSYEQYQIGNYGVGGEYYLHHDYFPNTNVSSEDSFTSDQRIATFMVYLSDVQAGGATVFPNAGISLFPNKGSAVFWYNLFNNGTEHPDTLHAACPVLLGSKWVGNLWIRRHGQEFTKPCDLDRYHSDWS
ncbi:prolyl 4-hydroxylase subunit alpha-1-like [Mya arenaria]|uniref:prolyl 4-hydroxylase subunit alpha-1-like n=1 Tax=Mya arenaria TaxID=6604 RepID=UPI0022E960DF|nr:prolyl 4-hydroxylase subunit alpha-1-like [Mya arenaria]